MSLVQAQHLGPHDAGSLAGLISGRPVSDYRGFIKAGCFVVKLSREMRLNCVCLLLWVELVSEIE